MSIVRNALLGAAGLVVLALPASAASSTTVGDTVSNAPAKQMQIAQRNENPGGAGFRNENPGGAGLKKQTAQRNENPGGAGFRNENPGGAGLKKAKKSKKKKM